MLSPGTKTRRTAGRLEYGVEMMSGADTETRTRGHRVSISSNQKQPLLQAIGFCLVSTPNSLSLLKARPKFYHYNGQNSTPSCWTSVTWKLINLPPASLWLRAVVSQLSRVTLNQLLDFSQLQFPLSQREATTTYLKEFCDG